MPSACMKTEKKASVEVEDPLKQAINVVEKKVRNLEKRKGKLDEYKEKVRGGATLNDDQKQAVSRYDSVLTNLEFAKELQKQFCEIQEKAEKLLKKKLRFEQKSLHFEEVNRMQEVLRLQSLLDSMGSDDTREHFKSGSNGAVILSEDKLTQLDELYKLISPTRDGETSYAEQLQAASEHIVSYLDAKDKEVAGTTYKQLKDTVAEISKCGYFERTPQEAATVVETEAEQDEEDAPVAVEEPLSSLEEAAPAPAPPTTVTAPTPAPSQPISFTTDGPLPCTQVQPLPAQGLVAHVEEPAQLTAEEESFFSTLEQPKQRAFTDIVSSVQGNLFFLQDSEIDTSDAAAAAHADPAVVAARPMRPAHQQHQQQQGEQAALAQSYDSQAVGAYSAALQDQMAKLSTQSVQEPDQVPDALKDSLSGSQSFRDRLITPQAQTTVADQSWGNSAPEHNSWAEQASSATQPQSWAEQVSSHPAHQPAWSTGSSSQQSMSQLGGKPPAPIPMPNETVPGQSLSASGVHFTPDSTTDDFSPADREDKKSQLNPNANIFMYGGQEEFPQAEFDHRRSIGKESAAYGSTDKDDIQTQGYRGGQRDYRSSQRGGGPGRGSRGGSAGMNGYQRGGRGGTYAGGNRGSASGSYQNGSRGGRGGGNGSYSSKVGSSTGRFQGYPPRSDYEPEGGFQGSSPFTTSSSLASSHLRVRSDEGATQPRAGDRGGMRGGGSRGGAPRGTRGGNQGYAPRPASGQ